MTKAPSLAQVHGMSGIKVHVRTDCINGNYDYDGNISGIYMDATPGSEGDSPLGPSLAPINTDHDDRAADERNLSALAPNIRSSKSYVALKNQERLHN